MRSKLTKSLCIKNKNAYTHANTTVRHKTSWECAVKQDFLDRVTDRIDVEEMTNTAQGHPGLSGVCSFTLYIFHIAET